MLAIGKLKTKIETALVKRVAEEANGTLDHKIAYQILRKTTAENVEEEKHVESNPEKHSLP